jgi:hypothetical protein
MFGCAQHVSDLVEGLIKLMDGPYTQSVNLGHPQSHSVQVVSSDRELVLPTLRILMVFFCYCAGICGNDYKVDGIIFEGGLRAIPSNRTQFSSGSSK